MKSSVTRRSFLGISVKTLLFFTALTLPAKKAFAFLLESIRGSRTESTYEQDRKMPLRKSQDNPMVKQIYKDFLEHPNSHKAHELLHTEYTDRSAGVKLIKKNGIKLNF